MAGRGRPPKPTALKVLQGNAGKRKINRLEPAPAALTECPEPPAWLLDDAGDEWRRVGPVLAALGLLTTADLGALEAYCVAFGEWRIAYRALEEHGRTVTIYDEDGMPKFDQVSPWVTLHYKALERLSRLGSEFGLSPSSRTRIKAPAPEPVDPFARFDKGARRA